MVSSEDYKAQVAARKQALFDQGFYEDVASFGGMFGSMFDAAICRTCYALVPVVGESIAAHHAWHDKLPVQGT